MARYSVVVVEDDIKIAKLLEAYFEKDDFAVFLVHEGHQALRLIKDKQPDIVILDLMLPGLDGMEICRQLRKEFETPIIMLTARDEEVDRLNGLEIGADDYVTKPFSPREVVARAKAVLRRTNKAAAKSDVIKVGNLFIDIDRHQVTHNCVFVDLTPTEFKILGLLAASPGQVFSRLQIIEQVQGYAFEGYERTIDAHMKNLRRKIEINPKEPCYIQTVYGVGYKFDGGKDV